MKILIGCINFHSRPFTELWLKSLSKNIEKLGTPLESPTSEQLHKVVVLNNSPEDNLDDLKHMYPGVVFIEPGNNLGVAAGWNRIIKEGFDLNGNPLYDYYMPTNNDIYFTESWLDNFLSCLQQDTKKEYGWISSFCNDYKEYELTGVSETIEFENRYWNGVRIEADDMDTLLMVQNMLKIAYAPFGGVERFAETLRQKYGIKLKQMHQKAPCFALSKECIKEVGLFDEYNSPIGLHEDADYGKRIELSRFKFGAAFGAYVMHFSMMSRTKGEFKKEWWVESREKAFQEKWGVSSKEMHKITKDKKFKLDLGSGYGPRKDGHWYHMEIDPKFSDIEFLGDISKELPFDDESMSEIYASNCLEHCEWKTILGVLYEWRRVLATGGKIEIRVPNFRFAAERYLEGSWKLSLVEGTERNLTHLIFGGDNPGYPHLHKVGLDYDNLSQALKDVGFSNIVNASDQGSWELKIIAEK